MHQRHRPLIIGVVSGLMCLILCSTLAWADNDASSCPSTTVNDPANTCYTVTPPLTGIPPTIDGNESEGVWTSAQSKNLVGGMTGTVKMLRGSDALYFAITINAPSSPQDRLRVFFDPLHNHATTSEDVEFTVNRNLASPNLRKIIGGAEQPWVPATLGSALMFTSAPGSWTVELKLALAEFAVSNFPPVMGLGFQVDKPATGDVATWPENFDNTQPATTWANLKTRYPIEYGIVLDYSGSMLATDTLTEDRWTRAKRAADLFVATLGLFKESYIDDKVSVSQYSWTCGNDAGGNTTGPVQGLGGTALVSIPPPPTGNNSFTAGNRIGPAANNCTPIAEGLRYALSAQQLGPVNASTLAQLKNRIVLLLSDGFHNIPSADASFGINPGGSFTANDKAFTEVETVALGPDGSAGTQLLSDISAAFKPSTQARYNQTNTFAQMLTAYVQSIQEPLGINSVNDAMPLSTGGRYTPGPVSKMVVIGVWNTSANASNLTIQRTPPTGPADPPITGTISNTQIGYAAVVVNNPPTTGTWTITAAAGGTMPNQRFVLVDLRVLSQFLVEQLHYGVGEPILLQVQLTDMDQPILGAEATAEVAKPGEGLGDYLSTIQEDCSIGTPTIPRGDRIDFRNRLSLNPLVGNIGAAGPTAAGDPLPGRYALAAAIFERCKKDGLKREDLPGEKLYDDGTHGDAIPGDGIYSFAFTATNREGSYNFIFHVRGKTSDGLEFTRTRSLSQFVRVKPSAENTDQTVQLLGVVDRFQMANVFLLPRGMGGVYLGPGFANAFTVRIIGGQLVGPLGDLGNGYYQQPIRYLAQGPAPVITIEMPGTTFTKVINVGQKFALNLDRLLPWLLLFIIVILLLLLFLCWRRRVPNTEGRP